MSSGGSMDPEAATQAASPQQFALSATHVGSVDLDRTAAPALSAGVEFVAGARAGRYILLEKVGAGAMGVVWSAWDPKLDRRVAIKVVLRGVAPGYLDDEARLAREAQALARLAHPNVVGVFDVVAEGGGLFLAMEFVDGWTLREWVSATKPPADALLAALLAAGQGLAAAHRAGLVHRDFKPDNVMIGRDGRVRVMDFGLAQPVTAAPDFASLETTLGGDSYERTAAGVIVGTPAYMAPEVFLGQAGDARSDLFAFCATAWEALCGQRPFVGENIGELRKAILSGRIAAPPAGARLTRHQRAALERGLETDPERRWPTLDALLAALAVDPGRARRRRLGLALGGLVAVGVPLAALGAEDTAHRRCRDPEIQLAGVWDRARRGEVAAAMTATGSKIAEGTWRLVQEAVDGWSQRWVEVAAPACAGESVLAPDLRVAQARCLAEGRAALDALLEVFASADLEVVNQAYFAVANLAAPERCADPLVLAAAVAPPPPSLAAEVARLEGSVTRAGALWSAGAYPAAEAALREVIEAIEATGYAPLVAEARLRLGDALERRRALQDALDSYSRALQAALQGRDELRAARAALGLAGVKGARQNRPDEAALPLLVAAAISRSLADPHELVVHYEHVQAVIAVQNSDPAAAREWYAKELERRRSVEPDSPAIADVLLGLAAAARGAGDFDEAERQALAARAHYERVLAPGHPKIAFATDIIGAALYAKGRYAEARDRFQEALSVREAVLGKDHDETVKTANNLAGMLLMLGDTDRAEALYRQVLEARRRILDPGDQEIGTAMCNLASVLDRRGDHEGARELYAGGTAIVEAARGAEDPELAWLLLNFATNRRAVGAFDEALALSTRSAAIRERRLGAEHPFLAMSLREVGSCHLDRGEFGPARAAYERALAIWEKAHGASHPDVARAHAALAEVHLETHDLEAARREAALALEIFAATGDSQNAEEVAAVRVTLARAQAGAGDLKGARESLVQALAGFGDTPSPGRGVAHRHLAEVLQRSRDRGAAGRAIERARADLAAATDVSLTLTEARAWLARQPS